MGGSYEHRSHSCQKASPRNDEAAGTGPAASTLPSEKSDHANVLRFVTLAARGYVELDVLTLFERLVSLTLNVRVVDEDVLLTFERDEAEALLGVEEFHCSCSQPNCLSAQG
jgi:hypothetical protein